MSNGLSCCFGSLTRLLPAPPVDHRTTQGNPSPSLGPHYRVSSLLRDGPPACPASVLWPLQFPLLGLLPLASQSNTPGPRLDRVWGVRGSSWKAEERQRAGRITTYLSKARRTPELYTLSLHDALDLVGC